MMSSYLYKAIAGAIYMTALVVSSACGASSSDDTVPLERLEAVQQELQQLEECTAKVARTLRIFRVRTEAMSRQEDMDEFREQLYVTDPPVAELYSSWVPDEDILGRVAEPPEVTGFGDMLQQTVLATGMAAGVFMDNAADSLEAGDC